MNRRNAILLTLLSAACIGLGLGETIECIASTLGRTCAGIAARGQRFGLAFGDDGRVSQAVHS